MESLIYDILVEYQKNNTRNFQKKLIRIPDWNSEKINKVHNHNDTVTTDTVFNDLFKTRVYELTDSGFTFNLPPSINVFHKCLLKNAKYYYQHPKDHQARLESRSDRVD